jgi:diguanylate cyclase (GGDEF)-like protein
MCPDRGNWSTQQLTEFLAAVSSCPDPETAGRVAVERAAEALEAEVGALLLDGAVVTSVGFPAGGVPEAELELAAKQGQGVIQLPGLGPCRMSTASIEDGPVPATILLARAGDDDFDREDANLLRGMARVLALSLRTLRMLDDERSLRAESEARAEENAALLASLDERRMLLEQLSRIQETMSHRARLQDVLEAIARGAHELVGADSAMLRLIDSEDQSQLVTAAVSGLPGELLRVGRRSPVGRGVSGRAVETGGIAVIDAYAQSSDAPADFRAAGVTTAVGVPLCEHGTVIGSLSVASKQKGASFSKRQQALLLAFAEQASLALAAARTADTMRQAFNDSLTGLANRTLFLDRLENSLARAERRDADVTVLFIDLDRFKPVNDSLGHAAGDKLLIAVAERIQRCLRRAETAARLGGDEFAVLLEDTRDASEAARVADRIIDSLRAPFAIQDTELFISASVGIATGRDDPEDLLRNADVAMYRAKNRGKGRYEVFEPGMHVEAVERLELEADLQRAIERDELVLHYQPIVSLQSSEIIGVEALVRWLHPKRGLLPPGAFIPLAEETGLILPLGRWVLGEATRQVAAWQQEDPRPQPLKVSVNLSGWQLTQPSLIDEVNEALAASGLPPSALVLELTETILMTDTEASIEKLHSLKRLGVELAIDDFGTGYSSLRYLQRFPIDILKIAKPFVDGLASDTGDSMLARVIVDLSRNLGLETIAEGIEEQEQLTSLRALGSTMGQGYHFARPLEPRAMEELLFASRDVGPLPALRAVG